nr:SJCHGC04565 protein [Schistosoma japonicum]
MQINSTLHLGDFDDDSKTDISELIEPPRYIYDEKLNHTYYIKKLECRVFLALVYEGLKPHKDKQINEFIVMLADTICLHKVICLLKQQQSSSSSTDRRNLRSLFFH